MYLLILEDNFLIKLMENTHILRVLIRFCMYFCIHNGYLYKNVT